MTNTANARGSLWVKLHEILGLDLRSLALFRVLVGLLLLGELAARLPDLRAFFTDEGIVPLATLPNDLPISIHILNGSLTYQLILFVITVAFAVMLVIGWQTRLAILMSWFLYISANARNPAIIHNGDVFLRMCLFFAIFLPLGAIWSVDSRFRPRPREVGPLYLNAGTIAYIGQMCIVYWFAVLWKTAPEWRSEFTAVHYALHVEPLASPIAIFLRQFPTVCWLLTIVTMLVEAVGPLLVLFPFATQYTRFVAVVLFIGLHAGFGACLVLGNFAPVCWICWLTLMPPLFWTMLARWCDTKARREHQIHTTLSSEQCGRLDAFRGLLLLPTVTVVPGETDGLDADEVRRLIWLSPIFWPLAWIPGSILGQLASWLKATSVEPNPDASTYRRTFLEPYRGPAQATLVLFCLFYVFAWNVRTVAYETVHRAFPIQINALGSAVALEQSHGVFAPAPGKVHGWYTHDARLRDGTSIDPRTGEKPDFSMTAPLYLYTRYGNSRWRRFFQSIPGSSYSPLVPYYADWVRREWNRAHPDNPIVALDIWFASRTTQLKGFSEPQRRLLYRLTPRSEDAETPP